MIGHKISFKAKIGWCIVWSDSIEMKDYARVGSFNLIYGPEICMNLGSKIGRFNIFNGPYKIVLGEKAKIGKNNKISRGQKGISYGQSNLKLGELAIVTANHYIDMTRSVTFGDYSILAGIRSQIWTHGYVHEPMGSGRFRVDGEVLIGKNVYLGSSVIINPGVSINNAINVGSGSVVSKSLEQSGMYVSQGLRFIISDYNQTKEKLSRIDEDFLIEEVYEK